MKELLKFNRKLFIGVCVKLFISLLFAYPLMIVYNLTVPLSFGLPSIDYWASLGIYVICDMLFKPIN